MSGDFMEGLLIHSRDDERDGGNTTAACGSGARRARVRFCFCFDVRLNYESVPKRDLKLHVSCPLSLA